MSGEPRIVTSPETIGPILARVRRIRQWSQADFADQLARTSGMATVTRHEVSRWERGERVPSAYWLRWIAAVADEPLADLEQAAAVARALRGRMPVPGLTLPEIVPDADLAGRLTEIGRAPERVDNPAVDWLTLCLEQHRRVEDTLGARPLVGVVRAQLDVVAELTRQAPARRRNRMIDLAAQYAQFLGWMAVAEADHAAAGAWYGKAEEWARECGNADMAATAVSMRAHQAWGLGNGRQCLAFAEAARGHEGRISPGNQGMAAQTSARGHALLGDVDRARRDLDTAEGLLMQASDPAQTEPGWLYFYDNNWFTRQRGTIELQLGNYTLAADLLAAGLTSISPSYRRDAAWVGGCLAVAYAGSGQSEAAIDVAVRVAPDAVAVSRYGLLKLQEAARALDTVDPRRATVIREAVRQS